MRIVQGSGVAFIVQATWAFSRMCAESSSELGMRLVQAVCDCTVRVVHVSSLSELPYIYCASCIESQQAVLRFIVRAGREP